jgi:hypothetical protein
MEDAMRQPHVDDTVRLTQDIPELQLRQGDVGVVCSTWFSPADAYEVEFVPSGLNEHTRALLLAEQLQVEDTLMNQMRSTLLA